MAGIRLDKLLSNRTAYSRSGIRDVLKKGMVQVNGVTESDGSRRVDPDAQIITLGGKKIPGGSHTYFLVNKPDGYICATEDRSHPVVTELLPKSLRVKGLFPAGRLDVDSTGLVLLTDDGDLAHRMLAPKSHVPKYYLIRLKKPCSPEDMQRLADGLTLGDGLHCLPAQLRMLEGNYACIALHEGKFHQVKRMLAALDNHVESLHRVGIGGLLLPPDLHSGGYIEVFHKDIQTMLKDEGLEIVCEQIMKCFSSYSINESR